MTLGPNVSFRNMPTSFLMCQLPLDLGGGEGDYKRIFNLSHSYSIEYVQGDMLPKLTEQSMPLPYCPHLASFH